MTPSTVVSPVAALMVRLLTFVFLLISLIILTTNTANIAVEFGDVKLRFNDVYAYRYMLATIVIGIAYTLLQIVFEIFLVRTGNRPGGDGISLFTFYGDKAMSYMLATGTAAGFGATIDLKSTFSGNGVFDRFFNKANAAASILLFGFLFSAISSIFSSFSLPKRY